MWVGVCGGVGVGGWCEGWGVGVGWVWCVCGVSVW